jgi:uncharacterized protein YlzI (FlbEa/FlbD family)
MNGWIKLTLTNGKKVHINPIQITMFGEATDELTALAGVKPYPHCTAIFIAGMMLQVTESENEIVRASVLLLDKQLKKQQDNVIQLRERLNDHDKESWQSEE